MWERHTLPLNLSLSFSVVVLVHDCLGSLLHIFTAGVGPLLGAHLKIGTVSFHPSSHHRALCATNILFMFSILRPLQRIFRFSFLSSNQCQPPICCWYISIFNLGDCCYHDLDFGNLPYTFQFISLSLSIFPFDSNIFLIYVLPFPPSSGWPQI